MMKSFKLCLQLSCLLLSASVLAGSYGKHPMYFGVEARGQMVDISWHTKSSASSGHLDQLTAAITNASGYRFEKANDRLGNYTVGVRLSVKRKYNTSMVAMVALGIELGLKNGKGYRPIDPAGDGIAVTTTEWDSQGMNGVTNWSGNPVFAPALFVGLESMLVGIEYDAREYMISGNESSLKQHLPSRVKDAQFLLGMRSQKVYENNGAKMTLSFEVMTNLSHESDEEMEKYFFNMAKYGTDVILSGANVITSSGLSGTGTAASVGTRAHVLSVHTNITKASIGIGIESAEF